MGNLSEFSGWRVCGNSFRAGKRSHLGISGNSRLADAFEAVLGALYLSTHTLELVRPWLDPHFKQLAVEIRADPARLNYKAALQEWTQAHFKVLPEYRVQETSHALERFTAEVWLRGQQLGQGKGRSIKTAEQAAAQMAFLAINAQGALAPGSRE